MSSGEAAAGNNGGPGRLPHVTRVTPTITGQLSVSLFQRERSQRFEPPEVAVIRKDGVNAVFPAQRGYLGIEHQIAVCIRLSRCRQEMFQEFRAWPHEFATRSGGNTLQKQACCRNGGRRVENTRMRYGPHKFRDAKDGERPSRYPFGERGQPRGRYLVQPGFPAMSINQDVGVNGDHARSITS